jgi:hypothetical protein
MTCGEVRERLELFADGALGAGEAGEVGRHLGRCDFCRDYLALGEAIAAGLLARRARPRERRRGPARLLAGVAALAIIAATAVSLDALRSWREASARADSLAAAEHVLSRLFARGLTARDLGEHRFGGEGGAAARTVVVRVSGGPVLYEVRATVPPASRGAAPPVELTAICGPGASPEVRP